ncbi:integrin beta-7-like [Megalops cyprinoides]|uniref:integrin beta-7-like n=1 Tax=Megalops cyprinoides TaxID=118141 RepID=UPI0018645997|nr:integrin beta-7-like [Megalops cyprinoides]
MKGMWLMIVLLLHCVELKGILGAHGICWFKTSCIECVRTPGCAWCVKKDFLKAGEPNERRCDTTEALRIRNCSLEEVINPQPTTETIRDKEFRSGPGAVVQLRPQSLHLKLRVGVPQTFEVTFKRIEGYPIDLYYLMDFSYSMKDDLQNVKKLGRQILNTLRNVTSTVRIGFGSFVDKVAMPYVSTVKTKLAYPCSASSNGSCQPNFTFKNVLPLTEDAGEFERRVSKEKISANLDPPESGFDAMMQATVCQKEIGWGQVSRIIVYTSDNSFHMAGDGKLGGIYQPNDGKCHLNSEGVHDKGTIYDYPSVAHLSELLSANNIQLIFAVTEEFVPNYEALSELIPQSVVGVLKGDSSNVVQLISEAYENLSSIILLQHMQVPPSLELSYSSSCSDGVHTLGQKRGECNNVRINDQVNFTVTLSSSACLPKKETFIIKPRGINEVLRVTVETLCDCDCQDREEQSSYCSGNGTLSCGLCSCDEGHMGQQCGCHQQQDGDTTLTLEALCRQMNSSLVCSGHGSCDCGRCVCRGQYTGHFCHCDPTSCSRHGNMICGGRGVCNCGMCECYDHFTGHACECSTLVDQCQTGDRGLVCTHHGRCKCNQCQCDSGFYGEHCGKLEAPCQKYQDCVRCIVSSEDSGNISHTCNETCGAFKLIHFPDAQQLPCQDERVFFEVKLDTDTGDIVVTYSDHSGLSFQIIVFAGCMATAIVSSGSIFLIIYWVILQVQNQREYRQFLEKQKNIQ